MKFQFSILLFSLFAVAFLKGDLSAQQKKLPPTGNKSDGGTIPANAKANPRIANVKDAKNKAIKKDVEKDPTLAEFAIYEKTAPNPEKTEPVETKLPLELKKGTRIAFVGNTLLDRGQDFGFFESYLHQANPKNELVIRNFAWSADEVDLQPRPDNFATVKQHLTREKIDVIFAAFGFNESFGGVEQIDAFKVRLTAYLLDLKTSAFNGKTGPQIVLVSPIANENTEQVMAGELNNGRIAAYTKAMAEVAAQQKVGFANVFDATRDAMADADSKLTINGAHLNEAGYEVFADQAFSETFGKSAPDILPELRAVIVDKNTQYFRRYRPLNTFYYTGGRNKSYGYLDFLPAMRNFEMMTANREERAWKLARGESFDGKPVDDSNVPPLDEVVESRGANTWMTPKDEQAAFDVDPRFEVNLFASEEQFPEIACPIQMRWDAKGRMWVSCSTTYPHVYPGQEPNDKIVILEDTDGDGKADKCTTFADDVHIPLSFALVEDGCYVSEEPHLVLLRDTDGDGKADFRERVLTGFGTEDSHHALHDFVWTPDGDLLFREAIFHNSQVETAYGPVRAKNSAWFRFTPRNQKLVSFGAYPNTNPWGVTFTKWGHHIASHPIFASAFHATNPAYPKQHPKANGIPAYSGVCGHEFVDFPNWPEEFQGGMIKARYKPTNRIEFHKWVEHDDHFAEEYQFDILFSKNLSFIPVDCRFGPRGAIYICDWYNPVKGHAQYSLRDPRRDRKSGRIWRITPKNFKPQEPAKIADASVKELLENLKRPEYRVRYWTKREMRERDAPEVKAALDEWTQSIFGGSPYQLNPEETHFSTEVMWTYRNIGESEPAWIHCLIQSTDHNARAAATRQLRYWHSDFEEGEIIELLAKAAKDENALVRMEAANAASYIGTPEALNAILPILDGKLDGLDHLKYALTCALGSEALSQHWRGNAEFLEANPKLSKFVNAAKADAVTIINEKPKDKALRKANAIFDKQKDLLEIKIGCVPERMMFTQTKLKAKAGQPIKLTFVNPDATQHNWVLALPGSVEAIGMAGNEMAKDPEGMKKDYIPETESEKILVHSKLLSPDTGQILRFKAPEKPGTYPYLCTFPGHWIIMKGELVVE